MDLTSIIVVIVVFFGAFISAWGLYAEYRYTREPEFKPWHDYWIVPQGTNSWGGPVPDCDQEQPDSVPGPPESASFLRRFTDGG
jgi:hypothetical protein